MPAARREHACAPIRRACRPSVDGFDCPLFVRLVHSALYSDPFIPLCSSGPDQGAGAHPGLPPLWHRPGPSALPRRPVSTKPRAPGSELFVWHCRQVAFNLLVIWFVPGSLTVTLERKSCCNSRHCRLRLTFRRELEPDSYVGKQWGCMQKHQSLTCIIHDRLRICNQH